MRTLRLATVVTLVVCLLIGGFLFSGCDEDGVETQVNFLVEDYLDASFLSRIDTSIPEAFSNIALAMAYHQTQGYYELPFNQTAYDVDDGIHLTTDGLEDKIDPDNLYTWPNVINLSLLYDENAALLSTLLTSLSDYDQNSLIDSEIMPALEDGSRVFLARDFVTILVREDTVYTEIPYFLFINLDEPEIDAVFELQGFNPAHPFPDAPFIHDPHVEKLIQLLLNGTDLHGNLWQMCLRGNKNVQKFQAVVVSREDCGEFSIRRVTGSCEDCGLDQKYQFNPPFYPTKRDGEQIPVIEFGDKFNPAKNPNISLNSNLGQPAVSLVQGEVPGLLDENPIIPVPEDDQVITPGEEQESESGTGDRPSKNPCCRTWSDYTPSLEEVDCVLAELGTLRNSFEYWERSKHGTDNMDPVVQRVLDVQRFVNAHYFLNQSIFYSEVWLGLAFDDEYQTMVSDELERLISECDGCSVSSEDVQVNVEVKEDGATKTTETKEARTLSANCDCDCDAEGACLYRNPLDNSDYSQRRHCLEDAIDRLQNQIDDMQDEMVAIHEQFPILKLVFSRTTIWDNVFYDGVRGIDARAFCPSMGGPATQDYGVDDFFHNVYLGIVTNNLPVDEAITNAITEEMRKNPEAAGLVECALGQLKQSLITAYENELLKRGYSEDEKRVLLDRTLTPAEQDAVSRVQTLRRHTNLKGLLLNRIMLALVNMDLKQSECARTYMEKRHCELTAAIALMEGFRQSIASGVLDLGLEFKTNIPHCDICEQIQRLACCHAGNPACTATCQDYPADCCTDFQPPCGFMRYLICFGESALCAGVQCEHASFCPEFECNSDPSCEGNTCMMEETCEDTCLQKSQGAWHFPA